MIRIPYGNTNLTSLSEDMNVLKVLSGSNPKIAIEQEILDESQALEEKRGKKMSAAEMKKAHERAKYHKGAAMGDHSYGEDEEFDTDEDAFAEDEEDEIDLESLFSEDDDLDEDEDLDIFDDIDEDEDESDDTHFIDFEEAAEIIEAFDGLDDDEVDDLNEDESWAVLRAYESVDEEGGILVERILRGLRKELRQAKKGGFGHPAYRTQGVSSVPKPKMRKFLNKALKIARRKIARGQLKKKTLMIRALSKKLGPAYTFRGVAHKVTMAQIKAWTENPKAAKQWLTKRGGNLKKNKDRLRLRRRRYMRRGLKTNFGVKGLDDDVNEFHNLIEEFKGVLATGLDEDEDVDVNEGTEDYYESCEALIENFQKVGAAAETLAGRVANHMRHLPESEDPRDDPRFEIGAFLEGVARDAGSCLEVLIDYDDEGNPFFNENVDHDLAFEDLQSITSDLDRAIGALADLD